MDFRRRSSASAAPERMPVPSGPPTRKAEPMPRVSVDAEAFLTPRGVAALFVVRTKTVTWWANSERLTAVGTPAGHRCCGF